MFSQKWQSTKTAKKSYRKIGNDASATVKQWLNRSKYSIRKNQPGSFFVVTNPDNSSISKSTAASYHHFLKDKFLIPCLSSFLDDKCIYQYFATLSLSQHLMLEERCKGGVSVHEFDSIVESISGSPWTHVLLDGNKLEHCHKNQFGNGTENHNCMFFQIFGGGGCPEVDNSFFCSILRT